MKKQFTYIFTIAFLFGSLLFGSSVFAAYGLEETAGAAGLQQYGGSVPVLIGNVIGAALSMVSVIFFALMIYGGIRYMTARGNEEDTKKAIGTIWAAVIGIIIVLASYALTQFVFSSLGTGGGGGPQVTTYYCPVAGEASCVPSNSDTVTIEGYGETPCYTANQVCLEQAVILQGEIGGAGTN